MADKQCTLKGVCRYSGIALHTGIRVHLTLKPADSGSGIRICRVDLPGKPMIQALATNVIDVQRATTIANGDAKVHTVEHVLAALYALGVDNAVIEMDGAEPPIGDGSSKPFVDMIQKTGVQEQDAEREVCVITEPQVVQMGDTKIVVVPSDHHRISCTVEYGASLLDTQYLSLEVTEDSFVNGMCEARTFCLYEEIEYLMVNDLIRGGSLDNAVVIKDGAIISKDGLKYPDELVRHKMLDIVGDLSLIGRRLQGEVIAIKPGHPSNVEMAKTIMTAMGYN